MPEIAFVSPPELSLGAVEGGLRACPVEDDRLVEEKIMELAREGVSLIVVTEDLVTGQVGELKRRLRRTYPRTAIFVAPRRGRGAQEYLANLRESFAAALGVDVWAVAAKRTGAII